ncbi:hypothetical protein EAH89_26155 [Roseomonas nepalensis]|uniref:Uncharacterized protein n=1 Tax=Muricoccus nepalensis TaxID=1854500 RepID=A0A502F8H1_9PROT|nr:hypothetical protein [Roseomonas nepalensis]TPG45688.1 hypothetical protein EAH89_26155 [Roseomonas nepalensis]
MASATLSTRAPTRDTKSNVTALRSVLTPALRARIEAKVASLLDGATMLLRVLDDADRANLDMEPDADGEAEVAEASGQPLTLSPDRSPVVVHRPTAREMRAAYRRNGDPVPANLRRFGGGFGSAHA